MLRDPIYNNKLNLKDSDRHSSVTAMLQHFSWLNFKPDIGYLDCIYFINTPQCYSYIHELNIWGFEGSATQKNPEQDLKSSTFFKIIFQRF